jgi:hypothetical protein
MSLDPNNPERPPTPERLAAYADGEMSAADAEATEAWLREHPEAAAEVESQRRLAGLWQAHTPPEPAPTDWDKTLNAIQAGVRAAKPKPVRRGGSRLLRIGLGLAAACLALLLLGRTYWPTPGKPPVSVSDDEEPYPVAGSDEITIISMDPRESRFLVVGLPPINGDMEWASMDDVTLVDTQPNDGGQKPGMHTMGNVPVILPSPNWGGKAD